MITTGSIYDLLPAYFRRRDAEQGGQLKALFAVLEDGAALVEADIDAFEDALFVETCAEALLHEIGALVGAPRLRPLPEEAHVSSRAFIGNLVRYRRAKGTPRALEMLARDVTLYSAKAVEYYARLAATPSLRAPRLDRPTVADLDAPDILAFHGGAFDRSPRTPDMRSISRAGGRYNIPNVGIHLWRLEATPFAGPQEAPYTLERLAGTLPMTPWDGRPGHFALHPAGTATPLFMPQQNMDDHSPLPHEVPERLRRLPLKREIDALVADELAPERLRWLNPLNPAFDLYFLLDGATEFVRIPPRAIRIGALTAPPYTQPPPFDGGQPTGIEAAFDPATARLVVRATDVAQGFPAVVAVRLACAFGQPGPLGGGAYDRNDLDVPFKIDAGKTPDDGTIVFLVQPGAPDAGRRFSSLSTALAAWGTAAHVRRRGIIVVTANVIDAGAGDLAIALPAGCDLTIVAAEWRLPEPPPPGADPAPQPQGYIVRRSRRVLALRRLRVTGMASPGVEPGSLTLDGFVCAAGIHVEEQAAQAVDVRHCTLADGTGPAIAVPGAKGQLAVGLYRSICGAVTGGTALARLAANGVIFAAGAGIGAPAADLALRGITAFAAIGARSIEASDSIFMADVKVARTQSGCVRYSYVGGTDNRLPRRFRCQPDLAWEARQPGFELASEAERQQEIDRLRLALAPRFVDTEPDEPAYALPALANPREIAFGGENETEMGAWRFLGGAIRIANLTDLFADFVPFGMEAGVMPADRASVDAARRNLP
jgi:hypothetical protein